MYNFQLDGGEISVWRADTGEVMICLACSKQAFTPGVEMMGGEHGPYVEIKLSDERLAEFRYWLKGQVVKLATEQKIPEQV